MVVNLRPGRFMSGRDGLRDRDYEEEEPPKWIDSLLTEPTAALRGAAEAGENTRSWCLGQ